jgi:hypothetical protein
MDHRTVLALLCAASLLSACSNGSNPAAPSQPSTPAPAPATPINHTATLAPGEGTAVRDGTRELQVTFTGVTSDSRCPADAVCITAGEATLAFSVTTTVSNEAVNGATMRLSMSSPLQLSTTPSRASQRIDDTYTVALEGLLPYPFASQKPLDPQLYRATVRITADR